MIIVNKSRTDLFNINHIYEIFIPRNESSIRVNTSNGGRYELDRYSSMEYAEMAMKMIIEQFGKTDKLILPTEKELQAQLVAVHDTKARHIAGKKTKGHGGS